jgi:hypothetical protein
MSKCPFCARQIAEEVTVCPHCLRLQPGTVIRSAAPVAEPRAWRRILVLLLILGSVGTYAFRAHRRPEVVVIQPEAVVPTTTIAPPLEVAIADSAAVKIAAGKYLAFPFSGGGRSTCRVEGRVQGLAGGDRTANVSIVDAEGLAELAGGGTPRTYYESGPLPTVSLGSNVDGRTPYTLVVSNIHGRHETKTVKLDRLRASCSD